MVVPSLICSTSLPPLSRLALSFLSSILLRPPQNTLYHSYELHHQPANMAVLTGLPGVVVEILVDGAALKEYETTDDDAEDDRTVTRYIEASSDQTFAVAIRLLPDFHFKDDCFGAEVEADGTRITKKGFHKRSTKRELISEGLACRNGKVQKYRFSGLKTCA